MSHPLSPAALAALADPVRLAALESYGILDTPPEEGFDDIVQLARQICGAPVALVSLVTDDRQWFKARDGFPACETGLNASVCAHALIEPDLLIIPDLATDPRTRDNPLVTGDPYIQFYAGAPLRTPDGHVLGSLCVIDHRPRPEGLSAARRDALRALARQVVTQLELRRSAAENLKSAEARQAVIATQRAVALARGDLDAILGVVVAGALRAVPQAEGAVVELREGDELVYRNPGGSIMDRAGLRLPLRGSLAGACLLSGEAVLCPDVREDPRVKRDLIEGLHLRSCVLVPLLRGGEAVGVLKLQSSRIGAFGETDLKLAQVLAGSATTALADVALRAQGEVLQTVTDHVGQAVFQLDTGGLVTFANPAAEAMFGWPAADMLGRGLHELLHRPHADGRPYPMEESPLGRALAQGRLLKEVEDTVYHRDGSPRRVLVTNAPVRVGETVTSAVLTVSDVTERVRAEEALRDSQRFTAALLDLGDRLREISDVSAMTRAAASIVGETLGASRVGFGGLDAAGEWVEVEPDWTRPGEVSVAGRHRFAEYGEIGAALLEGHAVVVADVRGDPRTAADPAPLLAIGIEALVNMPVRDHGRTTTLFFVHDRRPRHWIDAEIAFMRAVADRLEASVAQVRAEEYQQLLNRELSHRMKNLLAMVQAIATQTMRTATGMKEAQDVLSGRLVALGRAHDLLMGGALTSTEMEPVIRAALAIHEDRPDRFRLSGPPVTIGTDQALSLALMLHELATNATKYGALSTEGGHVGIAWALTSEGGVPRLGLCWSESGGPPVVPPTRKGFGTRFIERGLSAQVGGTLSLDYPPAGVVCTIAAPLAGFQEIH